MSPCTIPLRIYLACYSDLVAEHRLPPPLVPVLPLALPPRLCQVLLHFAHFHLLRRLRLGEPSSSDTTYIRCAASARSGRIKFPDHSGGPQNIHTIEPRMVEWGFLKPFEVRYTMFCGAPSSGNTRLKCIPPPGKWCPSRWLRVREYVPLSARSSCS